MEKIRDLWAVFYLGNKELCCYSVRGTYDGELKATKKFLAHENQCEMRDIRVAIERRY